MNPYHSTGGCTQRRSRGQGRVVPAHAEGTTDRVADCSGGFRRQVPSGSMLLAGLAAIPALAAVSCGEAPAPRPNVIFILMDDAGYGDFGCYGQRKIETPNIDALSALGIRFTDMYASAPLSSPSRCGLLTGRHAGHAQIRANDEMEERGDVWNHEAMLRDSTLEGQAPMAAGTPTLGSVMKRAGYATGMVGKWGVGAPATESTPGKMGFDTYYGCICQRQAHTYYPPFLWRNDRRVYLDNELLPPGTPLDAGADPRDPRSYDKYTQHTYSPDAMYTEVIDFVRDHRDGPFFLMWTTPIPHSPMQAPDADVQYYVRKFGDEEPIEGKGYFPSRWPRATYAAMITYFDRQIGGLVAELERLGIRDNTLIVVTSDNGPASNSCSSSEWFDSAHPFRCGKGWGKSSLREGGIRMPFIVAWGDRLRPRVCDHVGFFPDVMPTLCDLAGVEAPPTDGISLLPILEGRESRQQKHEYLYWEFPGSKGWVAVRWGDWKGVLRRVKQGNDRFELYDLKSDPREEHDVAAEHPEIIDRMWAFVAESHTEPANPKFRLEIPQRAGAAAEAK